MVEGFDGGGDDEVGREGVDLDGLVVIVGDDEDVVLGLGGADCGDDRAVGGRALLVEFDEGVVLDGPGEGFIESGRAEVGGLRIGLELERLDLSEGVVGDEAFAGGGALEFVVVHQDKVAVFRFGDVDLHGARAGVVSALEGLDGVLGEVARRAAAMSDEQHAAGLAQAVEAFGERCGGGGC